MSIDYTGWAPTGGTHKHWSPDDPNRYNARRQANTEAWAEGISFCNKPIRQEPKKYSRTIVNEKTGQPETQQLPGESIFDDLGGKLAAWHNKAGVVK
jgi:hypothetical protein